MMPAAVPPSLPATFPGMQLVGDHGQAVGQALAQFQNQYQDYQRFKQFQDMAQGQAQSVGYKHDPTSLTPVGPYGHGPGGLFSMHAQDADVFSIILTPLEGIMGQLPVYNNADDSDGQFGTNSQEFYTMLTGVTQGQEAFTDQPTADCADGARAGLKKACTVISPRGRYRFAPNAPISIERAGVRESIADPIALRLMNRPAGGFGGTGFGIPAVTQGSGMILINELADRMFETGMSASRMMSRRVWVGNPALNSGERRDIMGFDLHINTNNKIDALTSNVCTAMNSLIDNANFVLVGSIGDQYQALAENMLFHLDFIARRTNIDAAWDGWIVMKPDAWEEISKVIPVRAFQESINQATLSGASAQLLIDGRDALNYRNTIRNQMIWPLRGKNYRVILDDGISELDVTTSNRLAAGQFASDIYFVNRSVMGGYPTTYWKYNDHRNANSMALEQLANQGGGGTFTSDAGVFRWYVQFAKGCLDFTFDFGPRLVVRCPQLCGRITNVAYAPRLHTRSPYPDVTNYFADGGRTNTVPGTFYTPWSTTTPVAVS